MSIEHRTLRVEREYPHPVSRVFAAWADPEVKRRWFMLSESDEGQWRSDFRVGGAESWRSPPGSEPGVTYDARYYDIVADDRIIVATEVTVGGRRTSVTLSTAEFQLTPEGSRLIITEQATFLDGLETEESRSGGMITQLDNLASWLSRA